ncbi:MAG: hypothetical protein GIS02_01170 [Methanosarcinales archaeon]|uniref:Uncharacterized protein n=1 Tax=Candidatus Ethanoperedens thermophilum TaxID=2766897 RepID=A0A848D4I4_9EURY|nr:hypothetical protein [Candidatus Ethanoperedens thermophilum]
MKTRMITAIDMEAVTTGLRFKTVERLKVIGRKGEGCDGTIRHLIDVTDYETFMLEQYKIVDEEDGWIPLDDLLEI